MASGGRRRRVAVVGGGVVGCATAFELARSGFDVTLLERDTIAAHASGRNAGNLNPLHGTPVHLIPFALDAFRRHAEIADGLARLGCASYKAVPVERVHLGYHEADRPQLEETAALFENTPGFSAGWLNDTELRRLEPRLASDVRFAVLTRGNLSVDGSEFCRSLAEGATRLGASVRCETASGVEAGGGRISGIRTSSGMVPCDDVVLSTGPWVADTEAWLGIKVPVQPLKGEILLMRLANGALQYDLTHGPTSLYQRRGDEVWVGVTMEDRRFDASPTTEAREMLLERAARILPDIRHARLLEHVAALRPVTPTNTPIAARAEGWENAYIANGGGSKGLLFSVGMAVRIRDLLT
jgi:glycine/D-amino acid oxidase-like deaminating enzyme